MVLSQKCLVFSLNQSPNLVSVSSLGSSSIHAQPSQWFTQKNSRSSVGEN